MLWRVWFAGFRASGEGYNGEYPWDFHAEKGNIRLQSKRQKMLDDLRALFREFLEKEKARFKE